MAKVSATSQSGDPSRTRNTSLDSRPLSVENSSRKRNVTDVAPLPALCSRPVSSMKRAAASAARSPQNSCSSCPVMCGSHRRSTNHSPRQSSSCRRMGTEGRKRPRHPSLAEAGSSQIRKKPSTWSMRMAEKYRSRCFMRARHHPYPSLAMLSQSYVGNPQFWPLGSKSSGGAPVEVFMRNRSGCIHVSTDALSTPMGRSPLSTTPLRRACAAASDSCACRWYWM
mmetsp:Transcript_9015/g.22597  ORF Transcript_9015/g.22597 Transcript_9015/m.22597 type:complete len:225 (+) Transcript_9015:660-1334(+)